ncbi:hypothetical protein ACFL7M_08340 [Thermodesulfobacteriota bacterium]
MTCRTLDNKLKIMQIFNQLIINRSEIKIRLKGEETEFTSKFIKINQDDILSEIGKSPELIIEKLIPAKGNTLIQSFPEITAEFLIQKSLCRCTIVHTGTSSTHPYFGHILDFPESIEIEEKRREERFLYENGGFVSVEFRLGEKSKDDKLYELNVFDCSKHGLCIIIPQKYFDLLQKIKVGDKLENITFYSARARINVDGTVRHKTKIDEGKYKDSYLIGIESPGIIEDCKPMKVRET